MEYVAHYSSPLGEITLAANDAALTGLWFDGQKYYPELPAGGAPGDGSPVICAAKAWLDSYFAGSKPGIADLPLAPDGSEFRQAVWQVLTGIPYGTTTTYGAIAHTLEQRLGRAHVSAQAVGGAVGHNRISIIIPCHRVVGSDGSMTGYAGGLDKKSALLRHEGADITKLFVPKKGSAL